MKLYGTLETSRGKVVSVSDNEQITATVYDGNMKAYSVTIEWCTVGDPERVHCDNCDWEGYPEELHNDNDGEHCPQCGLNSEGKLVNVPAVMGAIVTTREWRNEPENRRKAQRKA